LATETFSIYHDVQIKATAAEVFDAISNPDKLINWWPLKCSGKSQMGATYNFYFDPEYDWLAEVVKCETNLTIHYKMMKADKDWSPTSFGFDLEQKQNAILAKFWHTGWPECNDHFRRSSFCWALLLNGLKNYVEHGIIIPFEDRE
jgi:uncharacterized protein YndB with AHSA1/START domain